MSGEVMLVRVILVREGLVKVRFIDGRSGERSLLEVV